MTDVYIIQYRRLTSFDAQAHAFASLLDPMVPLGLTPEAEATLWSMVDYSEMSRGADLAISSPGLAAPAVPEPRETAMAASPTTCPSSEALLPANIDPSALEGDGWFDTVNFDSPGTAYLWDLASGGG